MRCGIEIRESLSSDWQALSQLYPAAFPDEDLRPLVGKLLREEYSAVSLVAIDKQAVVGHIVFTMCSISGRSEKVALLGPVAVDPQFQKQGIGSALVKEGLNHLKNEAVAEVFVLGDPAYYGRFGFEALGKVNPPYPIPQEWMTAWQSIRLRATGSDLEGTLSVPQPWQQPTLWAP